MTTAGADAFRCSAASLVDDEPLAGTAPTDTAWLLLEHPGPWGRRAVDDARLPDAVRAFLTGLEGVRVQLVRRPGGGTGPGTRVFTARLGAAGARVGSTVLDDLGELVDLDLAALAAGGDPGLPAYDAPLWLVCTNGRRDRCCAEAGRPVAAALAAHWPEETWETSHLGGHRFAATLLALPSGLTLGRLGPTDAVRACRELAAGRVPVDVARGRAGLDPRAQVAELHLRRELGEPELGAIRAIAIDRDSVTVTTPGGTCSVRVTSAPGAPRRQSCADLDSKTVDVYAVEAWVRQQAGPRRRPPCPAPGSAAD